MDLLLDILSAASSSCESSSVTDVVRVFLVVYLCCLNFALLSRGQNPQKVLFSLCT